MTQGIGSSSGRPPAVAQIQPHSTLQNRGDLRVSVIVALLCLLVYNANLRSISAADTYGARYLPFGIWRYHTVLIDPVATVAAQGRVIAKQPGRTNSAFWIVRGRGGRMISLYPITLPVLISPLYFPAVLYLASRGWDRADFDRTARIMEKLSASLLAAASAALLYLLLRRRTSVRASIFLTIAYAFGTTTWMISSQGLWQHTLGELLVVAALLVVTGPSTAGRAILAGILCGLIACNRPPDSLITVALATYALFWWAPDRRIAFLGGGALPAVFLSIYNFGMVGHYAGAYGLIGKATFFDHNLFYGLAVLLFSPIKGLFIFSPFLLAIPFGWRRIFEGRPARALTLAIGAAVLVQLLVYSKADWRQGASWGPRWLTDLLPILLWMLPPVVSSLRGTGRALFAAGCFAAIVIEAIGAFWYTGQSDAAVYAASSAGENLSAIWSFKSAPFIAELAHPRAPADLATEILGNFDTIATRDGEVRRAAAQGPVTVEGWALANGQTPKEVLVLLDGQAAASTRTFFPRPDVTRTLGYASPSGWRAAIPAKIPAGTHSIAILVRGQENGDLRYLVERRLQVLGAKGDDLAASAQLASSILENRQRPAGYWLTEFTNLARFRRPHTELNIFAIATLVDILSPVAAQAGLQENVQQARRFLSGQIESSGLVRYHGRPDAPTIGTLGCVITPDADDTSLVWRIAPGRPELMPAALAALERYRTPQGLYRTWLAPRERYECIDPGKDPDPADAVIQMHVLMFLSRANPPAARALCQSLKRSIGQDRVWVYYQTAPLLPILRQPDLRGAGCPIQLPSSRLETAPAHQDLWMLAGRWLARSPGAGDSAPHREEALDVLRQLARDSFSPIRETPPLLYHNDLTASVSRYYWSQELGYALWLRLYFETIGHRTAAPCAQPSCEGH